MEDRSNKNPTTIVDLPADLLAYILTTLSTIDNMGAALVSRAWQDMWCSLPTLSFSHHLFSPHQSLSTTRQSFVEVVNSLISSRFLFDAPLLKFNLQFYYGEYRHNLDVSTWIFHAIQHKVEELDIDFSKGPNYEHCSYSEIDESVLYNFDFTWLKDSCVKILRLSTCSIVPSYEVSNMQFACLKSLFLDFIQLSDKLVVDILSGCVNLETLELDSCFGMKDVKISSLRLKELILQSFCCDEGSLEIVAPRLLSLSILFFKVGKYVLKAMSLLEANVSVYTPYWSKVMKLLGHVKCLRVVNDWSELMAAKGFVPHSTQFYGLRHLHLRTHYTNSHLLGLAALFQLTPNVETMILYPELDINDQVRSSEEPADEQIKFSLPSLKHVMIISFGGTNNELHLVMLLKRHAVLLEDLELVGTSSFSYLS